MTGEIGVVVVGDAGVGKSTFITRHSTGELIKKHTPSRGVSQSTISHITNTETTININFIDHAATEKGVTSMYKVDFAIIMIDLTVRIIPQSISFWYTAIRKKYPKIPIIVCGNKSDSRHTVVKLRHIERLEEYSDIKRYYEISCKSSDLIERPLSYISRCVSSHISAY